jgi:hypothetical protein
MNNKLTLKEIRNYLKTQILCEDDSKPIVEGNDSVDFQIDRLIAGYRSDAMNMMNESYIHEAADDDENKKDGVDKKEKSKDQVEQTPKVQKKSLEEINIREFCLSISNLIENIENLVEFKNTILRRTLNTLNKDFNQDVIRQCEIILEDEFGLVIGKSDKDLDDERHIPTADRAGPMT